MGISVFPEGKAFTPMGRCSLEMAPGASDYLGQAVRFDRAVRARFVKWQVVASYRGGQESGLSEVRFANADQLAAPPPDYSPKYPRPAHRTPSLGQPLAGAESIALPPDAGIADVTKPRKVPQLIWRRSPSEHGL